ncbi:MAG TPA: VWA domain-containing protein [Polyangiaceae bacterium]|nr:VWA domain-containing protein [Polyangiaceae bacterium]
MTLAGLPFATLAAIFGAVAAATTVLYVLKLRRRPVPVPFARIWDSVLRDRESSRLFSQLKRWLSLLVQLVLVFLLVFALGDPRLGAVTDTGRNIVVLVDASASMKSVDETPTRLEAGKEQARRFVKGLGASDRALIVQMDMLPTPRSTLTGEPSELVRAIDAVHASDTPADFPRALSFAADSLRGLSRPEIVVVTDGALSIPEGLAVPDIPVHILPVGKSDTNLAITEFAARRYPLDKSRIEVMLEITNTNPRPAEVELTLLGDGTPIEVSKLRLGPEERLPRFYTDIAGANRRLEARIRPLGGEKDVLPADDRAYALMPERRRARVLVVTSGNTYLEAALLLDEYLDVTYVEPGAYPKAGRFDVTVFDGVAPAPAAHAGSLLYLNPPAEGAPVKHGKSLELFGFDRWDRKHPLVRFLALGDVQVARGHALVPDAGDKVVGASELGAILVAGRRGGQSFVALGFDPRNSDFVLRPAWPLFVLGTINHFVDEDSGYLSSFRTGQSFRIPAPTGVERATLTTPRGERLTIPVKEGRAAYFGTLAGFYKLEAGGAEPVVHEFAANLVDLAESRVAPRSDLALGKKPVARAALGAPGVRRRLWAYLLVAVVVVSVAEWFTYHRRVTV